MRVYLDNCCYNRPFDPQSDLRIHVETVAKGQMRIANPVDFLMEDQS